MKSETKSKILELANKWESSSTQEKEEILQALSSLSEGDIVTNKISQLEKDLNNVKTRLSQLQETLGPKAIQAYSNELLNLQGELDAYKNRLINSIINQDDYNED